MGRLTGRGPDHWGDALDPTLNRDLDDLTASYAGGATLVALSSEGAIVGTGTVVPRDAATAGRRLSG